MTSRQLYVGRPSTGVPMTDAERQALRRERVAAKRASLARELFLAKDRQDWAAVEQVARELMRL